MRTHVKSGDIFLSKLHVFKIKIFVFRKKHVAQISYQSHLLALHTVEILYNLILRNHWTWTCQISDYINGLGLIL